MCTKPWTWSPALHRSGMVASTHYHSTCEVEGEVSGIGVQPETLSIKHKLSGAGDESINVHGLDGR